MSATLDTPHTVTTDQLPPRVLVCSVAELPSGEVATARPSGHAPISVFHTDEGLFAIDDTCTHQDASLADGWVEDCKVECPLHEACFDLRTGAASGPPAKVPVRTYAVEVDNGSVFVVVPASA